MIASLVDRYGLLMTGYLSQFNLWFAITGKRRFDHPRRQQLAADIDLTGITGLFRYPRKRNRALQGGRKTATGDFTFTGTIRNHLLVVAQYTLAFQQQADELLLYTVAALLLQHRPADKIASSPAPLPAD